jgi:hypothetical protein
MPAQSSTDMTSGRSQLTTIVTDAENIHIKWIAYQVKKNTKIKASNFI